MEQLMKKKIHNFVQSGEMLYPSNAISITESLLKNKRLWRIVVSHANINRKWKTRPNTGHTQKNGAVSIVNTIETAPFFCVCPVL
jgi:hypothetical protein